MRNSMSFSRTRTTAIATATTGAFVLTGVVGVTSAVAAQPDPGLGTAKSYAVLAGTTVTNTGPSHISGNLGVSPGTAITGFPPGNVANGVKNSANASAAKAEADLTNAWVDSAGRGPATAVPADIGGKTLLPGVYHHASGLGLTGTVTLDAKNNPAAVFIFQAGSTLITASGSRVKLINGAQPCNVWWQVGSSATLGTDTTFVGTVMALTSVTVQTRTTVDGRILARNGQVSLDSNVIGLPSCDETTTSSGGGTSGGGTTTTGGGTLGGTLGGVLGGTVGGILGGGTNPSQGGSSGGGTTTGGGSSGGGSSGGSTPGDYTTTGGPRIPVGHPHTGLGGAS